MRIPYSSPRAVWARLRRHALQITAGGSWSDTLPESVRHNLRWFWMDGFFASISDNVIVTYLSLYVLALGATGAQIGLMSSLSSLTATIMLMPGAILVERWGKRKLITVLFGGGGARLIILCLVFAPLVVKSPWIVYFAILLSVTRDAFGNLAFPAWFSLTAEIVPLAWRGRFFSNRNIAMGIAGMITTLIAGTVITRIGPPLGYQVALAFAFSIGMISTFSFNHIHDRRLPTQSLPVTQTLSLKEIFRPLSQSPSFLAFALIGSMWNFSLNIAGPFFNVFMVDQLKTTATIVGILSVVSTLSSLPAQRLFGILNDRFGPRRIQMITGFLIPFVPTAWVFVRSPWHILPINIAGGALWAGYNLAAFNMLILLTPEENRARYTAIYQMLINISLAIGAAFGGLLISHFGYLAVFIGSGVGRMITSIFYTRLIPRTPSGFQSQPPVLPEEAVPDDSHEAAQNIQKRSTSMDSQIENYLNNHPTEAQTILETLTRQPSVAAQNLGIVEMADLTESLLKEAGFETRQFCIGKAPPLVFGEQKGKSDFTLLLYNHYDVQPPDPLDLWQSPPFTPTVRDGKIFGRGVSDNKGEIASRLAAIKALRAVNGDLPITIRWIIEGEEEIGSPHFGAYAEQYADFMKADGCLWEGSGFDIDDRPMVVLGAKGLLYVQFDVEEIRVDAHSAAATILPSAAWRLVNALKSIKDSSGKVLIPGFYDEVQKPTQAELDALEDQSNMENLIKDIYGIDQFVDGVSGLTLKLRQAYSPTGNIAGLLSGYTGEGVKTVLPARAMAKMDFRLVPNQDPNDIFDKLRNHLNAQGFSDIRLTKLGSAEPVVTPMDHPFVRKIVSISESFSGKTPSINPIIGGTLPLLGDLRRFVGVPGLAAPGNVGYWASGAHAPNEHIRLSDMERGVRFNCHLFTMLGL